MAHRTTQRRILAPPPDPKPTTTTQNPDQKTPCKLLNTSKNSSKSNPTHKIHRSQKPNTPNPPPQSIDTHSQAKSMTVSAIFDSSKYSLSKSNPQKTEEKYSKRASKEVGKKKNYREPIGEEKKEVGVVKEKELNGVFEGYDFVRMPAPASLGGGRRRSFGGEKVELGDFLAGNGVKIVSVDMPPFMQIHAVNCARKAFDSLENFTSKTLALTLKKEFDGVYGPAWHCIVGKSFGSFVTHSVGGFLYFSMDQKLYILLFKTTVQRAD